MSMRTLKTEMDDDDVMFVYDKVRAYAVELPRRGQDQAYEAVLNKMQKDGVNGGVKAYLLCTVEKGKESEEATLNIGELAKVQNW